MFRRALESRPAKGRVFPMKRVMLALGMSLAVGAAAHAQDPLHSLFISPCGEPFRGEPGQPYPVAAWFAAVDANKDGAIDKAEMRANFMAFFKTLDVNGDGLLSPAEISRYERE